MRILLKSNKLHIYIRKYWTKEVKGMGIQLLLGTSVVICVLMLLSSVTKSKVIGLIGRACMGSIMIVVMNCLLPQYVIGVSLYTIGFTALLGMPGLMTLYLLQMLL